MPTPNERLRHLLDLAASGPGERAALAGEVADLLLDWPAQYSAEMRGTFEALLERAFAELTRDDRKALAARFEGRQDFSPAFMNELFLSFSHDAREAVLERNAALGALELAPVNGEALLGAARHAKDFPKALAASLNIPEDLAADIAADPFALCVAARGAGVGRAAFSGIAILIGPTRPIAQNYAMLAAFDRVPVDGAARLLKHWQSKAELAAEPITANAAA